MRSYFVQEQSHGPAVKDYVMKRDHDDVLCFAQPQQDGTQQWPATYVKGPPNLFIR